MITDKDVKKLKEVFATKDDLKTFATKDDLKTFATKDDLKTFATKDDLKTFATKDDLKDINKKIDKLDGRIKNGFESLAKDVMTVIEMIGDNNQKLDKINAKTTDHDDILGNHDRRLDKIEDKIFATT